MPRVPSTSPLTSAPTPSHFIHTAHHSFLDSRGRTLLLRGVNLSGAAKAPVGQLSHTLDGFWESAERGGESFVGRPLNVDDGSADVHLARLKGWGYNFLRFPVTWEALEHEGPGIYDEEFIDYTIRVLLKCKEYGFKVYMDPHQDTWSRFSGGSGAPFWTLPLCGINPANISATQAAILHNEYPTPTHPDPSTLPAMIWSTNYGRLLSQTLFTLFFAGRDFAPKCIVDSVNVQDYLQGHFIAAFGHLADRIAAHGELLDDCVIGWDSLNEPFEGLVGWGDISHNPEKQGSTLKKGTYPTPAQGMRLGMGQPQTVDNWKFGSFGPARDGSVTIDPKGRRIWADPEGEGKEWEDERFSKERPDGFHPRWGWKRDVESWKLGTCIWAQHGVWDVETGYVLRPDYFQFNPTNGEEVEFINDYWKPHFIAYGTRIRKSHAEAILFVQPPVFAPPPQFVGDEEKILGGRAGYSPHYYDGLTLVTRHWNWFNADALGLLRGKYTSPLSAVKIGSKAIRASLRSQLGLLKSDADILGAYPTIIGEIGTPFDMDDKYSYGKGRGDYRNQEKALDASLQAADGSVGIGYTVWTYVPDDGSWRWGDGWNLEDLSLWCRDDFREREEGAESRVGLLKNQSRAVLDRQPGVALAMRAVAAASELSLATLGPGMSFKLPRNETQSTLFPQLRAGSTPTLTPPTQFWSPNAYEFLTNGARAFRAFCRPWPVKVVGRVTDLEFDIAKASVRIKVGVTPDDAAMFRVGEGEGEKEKGMAEVYLPVVHFASPDVVGVEEEDRGVWGWLCPRKERRRVSSERRRGGYPPSESSRSSIFSSASSESLVQPLTPWETSSTLLAVEVKSSPGCTYSISGQTLSWSYPLPEGEEEGESEAWIEIRRKGGAIKLTNDGRVRQSRRGEAWWDPPCPPCPCPCAGEEGCTIM